MATNVPCGFGQGRKKKGPGCLPFCAAAPCCARTEKVSSQLPQKGVGKWQWCQSSEDDKEANKTEKKKSVSIFINNSKNTNTVL